MGDPNATLPTPQPVWMRPALAASSSVAPTLSTSFVTPAALDDGLEQRLGLRRRLTAIRSTRGVGKEQMINNSALPDIRVDPETFIVTVEGEAIVPAPATALPLAQRYTMF
jgi:urease subunit alpha